jgi:hypothetical protein
MRDFNHTVNVLVQAYMNNTLIHKDCSACAVGNIIQASGMILKKGDKKSDSWLHRINHKIRLDSFGTTPAWYNEHLAITQIDSTGYSLTELHLIERAFERAPFSDLAEEWNFNGLMAVVDVLADIHGIDLQAKESAKLLFVKA